jgi:hypothetical protein
MQNLNLDDLGPILEKQKNFFVQTKNSLTENQLQKDVNKNQINSAVKGLDNVLKAGNLIKLKRGRFLTQKESANL